MGNGGSCADPPDSAKWSLPVSGSGVMWDTTTNQWEIPLYGLEAIIPNKNPNLKPSSTGVSPNNQNCEVTAVSGSCTTDTCNPVFQKQCPACDLTNGEISTSYIFSSNGPVMGCSTADTYCFNTECSRVCSKPDSPTTCPSGGIYMGFVQSDVSSYETAVLGGKTPTGAPRALCQYTPIGSSGDPFPGTTITEMVNMGFPDPWLTAVIARYAIYSFVNTLNNNVYGDSTTSFHGMYNFTNPQSLKVLLYNIISQGSVQNILLLSPATATAGYINNFIQMLMTLAQFHFLNLDISTPSNPIFSMLFYSLGFTGTPAVGTHTQPLAIDMTTALRYFTTETQENVGSSNGLPLTTAPSNTFVYPPTRDDLLNNTHYIFVDLNAVASGGKMVYNIGVLDDGPGSGLISINQAAAATPNGDFYVVGRIFDITITNMSAVLGYWYSTEFPNLFTGSAAQSICGRFVADTSNMPEACYVNQCGPGNDFTDTCKTLMISLCGNRTTPNQNIFPGLSFEMSLFYMTAESNQCDCYNTKLRPIITGESQRLPGMCFTGACVANPSVMNAFGLTNQVCTNYCPTVYQWLTDPKKGSASRDYVDSAQYKLLCGENYLPTSQPKINVTVLVAGLAVCILCSVILWVVLRSIPITAVVGIMLMATAVFVALFLNGKPGCNPDFLKREQQCTSNFLSDRFPKHFSPVVIPNLFCPYPQACECVVDGQCKPQQGCLSGMCVYTA